MRTYIDHQIIEPTEEKIVCNKCGKIYECYNLEEWQADFMKNFKVSFGYASEYDGTTMEFDICEGCLIEFIKTFKIPVKTENWLE